MLEWLIVGGGIHGTHLSHVLLSRRGVARDQLAVLDPHPTPLHRWRECTRAVGMRYLRSPAVPGGALVDDLVSTFDLRCAACGYPIADASLQWRPGLFVMGPLAELELGPTARNITGARAGADRIARAA